MLNIKFDVLGKIAEGKNSGFFVKVIPDPMNLGEGYLLMLSQDETFSSGFDNWIDDEDSLKKCFADNGWVIEWF